MAGIAMGGAQGLHAQNARDLNDGSVQLTYPETHYSATAPVNLLGTTPVFAVDQLAGSGWWYRVAGLHTREYPLPAPDVLDAGIGGVLNATWNDLAGTGIKLEEHVFVADREGPSGGYVSELYATYPSGPGRTLYLYHYLDPDVTGTAAGDMVAPNWFTSLTFSEGTSKLHFRASAGNPIHFEAKPYPTLRDRLNDNVVDTLGDTWAGTTGDMSGAFQFATAIVPVMTHELVAGVSVAAGPGLDYVKGSAALGLFPSVQLQDPATHARQLWRMRRTNRLELEPLSSPGQNDILGSADFTGRKEDVLLERDQSGMYRIGGVTIDEQPPATWKVAATGDLNADGRADILWRDTQTQQLRVWTMNGTTHAGTITPDPDHAVDANWEVVGLADFNNGGALDFLWYNQTSRKLVIWYMNPSVVRIAGGFTNPALVGNGNWKALATADWGKGGGPYGAPDILWQNDTSGKLVLWHMDFASNRTSGLFLNPDGAPAGYKLVGPR